MKTLGRCLTRGAVLFVMLAIAPTAFAATNSPAAGASASLPLSVREVDPTAVNLGSAANFAILSESGITTTGTTSVVGNIGVSPIAAAAMTGFGLILDKSNQFATSPLVTGRAYAADYASPTPTTMTTAIGDMGTAYTDAAARTNPTATELGSGNVGSLVISPGLYKWSTGVIVPGGVTLSGGPNAVWIFQIAGTLKVSSGVVVTLKDGAQASNIFWQVSGQTTLGSTSDFSGNILDKTAIVMDSGATLKGRAMAQTAVTMIANNVSVPTAVRAVPLLITGAGHQNNNTVVGFKWTVVTGAQPAGFNIMAVTNKGKTVKMNQKLIPAHASTQYSYHAGKVRSDIDSWYIEAKVGSVLVKLGPLAWLG
jgi:hypothetical protein